jgi:hypothetical protein
MNQIIDLLVSGINKINIDKCETKLDSLIDQFENTSLLNPQQEWKNLQNNYSKLRYLKKVSNIINSIYFEKPFVIFIQAIYTRYISIKETCPSILPQIRLKPEHVVATYMCSIHRVGSP